MSEISSMTGFSRTQGTAGTTAWAWELRSVNGRGLDIKLRLAPGLDGLELSLREAAANFFRAMRALDDDPHVATLYALPLPAHGLGLAINERLGRAAS